MLAVTSTARIYLYMKNVDMRRSYDGLYVIVQSEFARDIRLGDYFMFINKRCDRVKIIWWDRDGLAIFMCGTAFNALGSDEKMMIVLDGRTLESPLVEMHLPRPRYTH